MKYTYFVARDRRPLVEKGLGPLYLYNEKPERGPYVWNPIDGGDWICESIEIDPTLFPELKWEDEPIEVELIIKPKRR